MEHGKFQCNHCNGWFERENIRYVAYMRELICFLCEAALLQEGAENER